MKTNLRIYETKDYELFSFVTGNRPLSNYLIKSIITAYKNGINLFQYNPILIDKDYKIYDGQHRFSACKQLGISIYYIKIEPLDIPKLVMLNNAKLKWNIESFTNSFVQLGFKDYEIVQDFSKRHDFGISLAAEVLKQKQPHMNLEYNAGLYKIKSIAEAEKIALWSKELNKHDKRLRARVVVRALISLSYNTLFDFKRFINKIKSQKEPIKIMSCVNDQLRYFELIYNWNIKDKENYIRLF